MAAPGRARGPAPANGAPANGAPANGKTGEAALTRRRQALGLLLLAGLILLIAVLRAPAHTLFPLGWWRL